MPDGELSLDDEMTALFDGERFTSYLKTMAYFYNYSCRNILLINQQMPHATKLASFKAWKEQHGRSVKKNEKALKIYAPSPSGAEPKKILKEKLDAVTGEALLDERGKIVFEQITLKPSINYEKLSVYDFSQTKGKELSVVKVVWDDAASSEAFMDALSAVASRPSEPIEAYEAIQNAVASKLNCKNTITDESVMFIICHRFGISVPDVSFDYVSAWDIQNLSGFLSSLDIIRKEAGALIDALENGYVSICNERNFDPIKLIQPEEAVEPIGTDPEPDVFPDPPESPPEEPEEPLLTEPSTPTLSDIYAQIPKELIPICYLSYQEAQIIGQEVAYELNKIANIECADAIDKAIKQSKTSTNKYNLAQAVRRVVGKFGKKRIAWVLALFIYSAVDGIKYFSKANTSWAIKHVETTKNKNGGSLGVLDEAPAFSISTQTQIMDIFIARFHKVSKERVGFKATLVKAALKSRV